MMGCYHGIGVIWRARLRIRRLGRNVKYWRVIWKRKIR